MIDARQIGVRGSNPRGRLCGSDAAMNPLKRSSHFRGLFTARLFGCVAQTVERYGGPLQCECVHGSAVKVAGSSPATPPVLLVAQSQVKYPSCFLGMR